MKTKTKKKIKEIGLYILKAFIVATAAMFGVTLQSCGVTKATINRPATGTITTVTITTSNPMNTNVNPNLEMKGDQRQ